jgi:glutaredoxin
MNATTETIQPVKVTLFRWVGAWAPFKVNIPCGECSLTLDVIQDTFDTELEGVPVGLDVRDWLTEWWKPLFKGGWHAPIVMVEGKLINQGQAFNRGVLTEAIIDAYAKRSEVSGNVLFGKATCPHCVRAKSYLDEAGIDYAYHDVVRNPRALYEMLTRVKPIVGPKPPITVPRLWLDGRYFSGTDQLSTLLEREVEPNPDRGQSSLSAKAA